MKASSIDWESPESHLLLNPKRSLKEWGVSLCDLPQSGVFEGHIWLSSSGTTAANSYDLKLVGLSKKAILTSATSVNRHLQVTASDLWINTLPEFHVGGLGILARAYHSGSSAVKLEKWNPFDFCDLAEMHQASLTSLVPAQVFDLVANKCRAPASIRAVVVGGGHLDALLHEKAAQLGWPILPSYGMSECASQIATAKIGSPSSRLVILDHVALETDHDNHIMIKSPALLTAYAYLSRGQLELVDPKRNGWFRTSDKGEAQEGVLRFHGREDDFIKIGGESVIFSHLEQIFQKSKLETGFVHDAAIVAVPDERLGHVIHAVSTHPDYAGLLEKYHQSVLPFERAKKIHLLQKLPRSPLGKLLKGELLQEILSPNNY